jgi:hypothetical protein
MKIMSILHPIYTAVDYMNKKHHTKSDNYQQADILSVILVLARYFSNSICVTAVNDCKFGRALLS